MPGLSRNSEEPVSAPEVQGKGSGRARVSAGCKRGVAFAQEVGTGRAGGGQGEAVSSQHGMS